jgi:serine/threonine-protein kinase
VPTKVFGTLAKVATVAPDASSAVIANRIERLSRALADANVADATLTRGGGEERALGKYEVIRKLSSGGMAEVFLAKQIGFGGFERLVAVKRIQSKMLETRQQAVELFLNEAKIAGRLTHPNIVPVLDVGQDAGTLYLAMEYVHGKDLRDLLKTLQSRRLVMELGDALYIAREVATALNFAYWSTDIDGKLLQVVHRDVSPHNVILGYDGAVKLLDFGVAMSSITEEGEQMLVGKWQYMSPEVTRQHKADHRSDLFSLGVLLYLMTMGTHPFTGADPREIIRKIRAGEYSRISTLHPDLPPELGALVERLLAPQPEHRPERGAEVVDAINAIARTQGLELSATRLAELLETHLPREEIKQFVRVSGPDDPTRLDRSITITPSARTLRRDVGISESFRRVTVETEAQPPASKRPTGSVPPMRKTATLAPPIRESMARMAQKPRTMLSFINIALLVGTAGLIAFVAYMLLSSS